jgi:NAD+ kinase
MTTIGILARPDLAEAGPALRQLVVWLRDRGVKVLLEERTAELADGSVAAADVRPARDLATAADALVVLGGDGTLLAASQAVEGSVPIVGVNFGSLGFLTEITLPELFPTLEGVLDGSARSEERRMLRATLEREGQELSRGDVLNDVVITKGALSRILELDVTVDGLFVSAFRADGLIVSSPTGSTAYNLAAGGPILHPALPAMVLTPICPHMLTNRPLVVSDQARVEIRVSPGRKDDVHITFDGQHGLPLRGDDTVIVTRSQRTIRLVKAPARDYYEVLRTKLKWGESTARRQG